MKKAGFPKEKQAIENNKSGSPSKRAASNGFNQETGFLSDGYWKAKKE